MCKKFVSVDDHKHSRHHESDIPVGSVERAGGIG